MKQVLENAVDFHYACDTEPVKSPFTEHGVDFLDLEVSIKLPPSERCSILLLRDVKICSEGNEGEVHGALFSWFRIGEW